MPIPSIISAACSDELLIFKVKGLGSMNNTDGMYQMVKASAAKNINNVCIDLEECEGVDSTFMGTLLLIHEESQSKAGALFVVNVSDYVKSKLDELGVAQIINIEERETCPDLIFAELPNSDDESSRMQLILKAHEKLVAENNDNADKFVNFIKALKGSIK